MHNGFDETRALTQVRAEAMTLKDRLRADGQDVWVEAVIVSVRGTVGAGRLDFRHASVVHAAYLASMIRDGREKLSPEQISRALAPVARPSEVDRTRRRVVRQFGVDRLRGGGNSPEKRLTSDNSEGFWRFGAEGEDRCTARPGRRGSLSRGKTWGILVETE